jgi:hypothetical protein
MRCEFNELTDTTPDKEKNRHWWSYIPFWISTDKFFIEVSNTDWEKNERPPSTVHSRLFGKHAEEILRKGSPADANKGK